MELMFFSLVDSVMVKTSVPSVPGDCLHCSSMTKTQMTTVLLCKSFQHFPAPGLIGVGIVNPVYKLTVTVPRTVPIRTGQMCCKALGTVSTSTCYLYLLLTWVYSLYFPSLTLHYPQMHILPLEYRVTHSLYVMKSTLEIPCALKSPRSVGYVSVS